MTFNLHSYFRYYDGAYAEEHNLNRQPETRRNCQCPEKQQTPPPEETQNAQENDDQQTTKRKSFKRLVGMGVGNTCSCQGPSLMGSNLRSLGNEMDNQEVGRSGNMGTPPNTMEYLSERGSPPEIREVTVTDAKNKTYKCIQVCQVIAFAVERHYKHPNIRNRCQFVSQLERRIPVAVANVLHLPMRKTMNLSTRTRNASAIMRANAPVWPGMSFPRSLAASAISPTWSKLFASLYPTPSAYAT